CASMLPHR
ncbi:hypothetical protein D047_3523B, partial [Vibrio parahaemolyticus VPTS-2010_2]